MGSLNPRIRGARGDYCGLPEGPRERFLDSSADLKGGQQRQRQKEHRVNPLSPSEDATRWRL